MVITHLIGGLGNQLFQYAVARRLAYKLNVELKIDPSDTLKETHHAYYTLDNFNILENFATPADIENVQKIDEKQSSPEEILNGSDNVLLNGFWQTEKYFEDIRSILLEEFTLKNPLHTNSAQWEKNFYPQKILFPFTFGTAILWILKTEKILIFSPSITIKVA